MNTNDKRKRLEAEAAQHEEEYRMMCEEPIDDTYDMVEEQQYWREQFSSELYARPLDREDW